MAKSPRNKKYALYDGLVPNEVSIGQESQKTNFTSTEDSFTIDKSVVIEGTVTVVDATSSNQAVSKGQLDEVNQSLSDAIEELSQSVEGSVQDLTQAISDEKSAREQADSTLQSNIDSESSAREAADTALQESIDNLNSSLSERITDEVNTLDEKITSLDEELSSTIESNKADIESKLQAEITRATSAEEANVQAIANETTARQQADTALQESINSEKAYNSDTYATLVKSESQSYDSSNFSVAAGTVVKFDFSDPIRFTAPTYPAYIESSSTEFPDGSKVLIYTADGASFTLGRFDVSGSAPAVVDTYASSSGQNTTVTKSQIVYPYVWQGSWTIPEEYAIPENSFNPSTDISIKSVIDLADEMQIRETYDAYLQETSTSTSNAVQAERSRAIQAEQELRDSINSEISRATQADQELQSSLESETTARESADSSLQSSIEEEVARATAAEQDLSDEISSEESARQQADLDLQANIDKEASTRQSEDASLLSNINTRLVRSEGTTTNDQAYVKLANGSQSMVDIVVSETANTIVKRDDAGHVKTAAPSSDNDSATKHYVDAAVEQIDAEAVALQNALNNEISRATAAEEANAQAIASETSARQQAVSNLQSSLSSETSAREQADTALQESIESETSAREAADQVINTTLSELQSGKLDKTFAGALVTNISYSYSSTDDSSKLVVSVINPSNNQTSTVNVTIPKATSSQPGLMTKESVATLSQLIDRVGALEGKQSRYLYTASSSPTADEINTFVLSQGGVPPFSGVEVVVEATKHIWRYYQNDNIGWRDDGADTASIATQTSLGIVQGSTENGKVFVEDDGTMSLNGYDELVNADSTNAQALASEISAREQADTALQTGKLDKVTSTTASPQVYAKLTDGSQSMVSYTSSNTASTIVQRDASGRISVGTPTDSSNATTKQYVDGQVSSETARATAAEEALDSGKVSVQEGYGLYPTTGQVYTSEEKTKLSGIAQGAQVNVLEGITISHGAPSPEGTLQISGKIAGLSIPATPSDIEATPDDVSITASGSTTALYKITYDSRGRILTAQAAQSADIPGLSSKANDTDVVHIAGAETITGAKTFSSSIGVGSVGLISLQGTSLQISSSGSASSIQLTSSGLIVTSSPLVRPLTDATTDLGSASYRYKSLYLSGTINSLTLPTGTGTLAKLSDIPSPETLTLRNSQGVDIAQYDTTSSVQIDLTKSVVGLDLVDNTADANKNVLSATKLTTARRINGVLFDGTQDITVSSTDSMNYKGEWSSSSTYSKNDVVEMVLSGAGVTAYFISLVDNNINNQPSFNGNTSYWKTLNTTAVGALTTMTSMMTPYGGASGSSRYLLVRGDRTLSQYNDGYQVGYNTAVSIDTSNRISDSRGLLAAQSEVILSNQGEDNSGKILSVGSDGTIELIDAPKSQNETLTIQLNGSTGVTYDGLTAETVNITPSSIGAVASNSSISAVSTPGFLKVAYDSKGLIISSSSVTLSDLTTLGVANDTSVVHLAGAETITGAKTFSSQIVTPSISLGGSVISGTPNSISISAATVELASRVNVTSSSISPVTTSTMSLGTSSLRYTNLYLSGTINSLTLPSSGTLATTSDITATNLSGVVPVSKGGTGVNAFGNNNSIVVTGSSSTASLTTLASGASGYILRSTGPGSLPEWVAPSSITGSTVTGVKGQGETSYRTGNVNLTLANLGLKVNDIAASGTLNLYAPTSYGSAGQAWISQGNGTPPTWQTIQTGASTVIDLGTVSFGFGEEAEVETTISQDVANLLTATENPAVKITTSDGFSVIAHKAMEAMGGNGFVFENILERSTSWLINIFVNGTTVQISTRYTYGQAVVANPSTEATQTLTKLTVQGGINNENITYEIPQGAKVVDGGSFTISGMGTSEITLSSDVVAQLVAEDVIGAKFDVAGADLLFNRTIYEPAAGSVSYTTATFECMTLALTGSTATSIAVGVRSNSTTATLVVTEISSGGGDNGIPTGGLAGQALTKQSGTDYDVAWTSINTSEPTVITEAAYAEALAAGTIENDKLYYIQGTSDDTLTTAAESTTYDNATSGLTATNVQDAIDELKQSIGVDGIAAALGLTTTQLNNLIAFAKSITSANTSGTAVNNEFTAQSFDTTA